jgi:hypothetical protein
VNITMLLEMASAAAPDRVAVGPRDSETGKLLRRSLREELSP